MGTDLETDLVSNLPRYLRIIRRELATIVDRLNDPARIADTLSMSAALIDNLVVLIENEHLHSTSISAEAANLPWTRKRELIAELRARMQHIERLTSLEASAVTGVADEQPLTADRLLAYLGKRSGCAEEISVSSIKVPLGGYSKSTYIAHLSGKHRPADAIVLRFDTESGPIRGSAVDEFQVLSAMVRAGVPVPEPLWAEADSTIFGQPFLVLSLVPGVPAMNYRQDLQVQSLRSLASQFAALMAGIHGVDPGAIGQSSQSLQGKLQDHVLALLDSYESQWHRRGGGENIIVSSAFDWMRRNIPQAARSPRIVHGDATLRNIMVERDRISGFLDWETWHVGDPVEDLAYCKDEMEQFIEWPAFMERYYECGGASIDESQLKYWSLWKHLRGSVTSVSLTERVRSDGNCDLRSAFGGLHYTRYCLQKVAEQLECL